MLDFRTETFLTVCETMNFTAAAKQLNITQPAVSHSTFIFQLLRLLDNGQISLAIVEGNYPKENYSHKKYSTENYIAVCAACNEFI